MLSVKKVINNHISDNRDCAVARYLLADILNMTYDQIFFQQDSIYLSDSDLTLFMQHFSRYKNGEPVSKIIGKRSFWKDEFIISKDVLDPRQDSETIIEAILENIDIDKSIRVLDIGTGSGCLIISVLREYKNAVGVAVDISEEALNIAITNANNILGNTGRISFDKSDFAKDITDTFDVIISNPPYIKSSDIKYLDDAVRLYDPILALDGGESGIAAYEAIAVGSKRLLSKDGLIFLEIGHTQKDDVCKIFAFFGYMLKAVYKDIQNIDRVVVFTL